MHDLITFLRNRLDDDEQAARAAIDQARCEPTWHVNDLGDTVLMYPPEPDVAANLRSHGMHDVARSADHWNGIQIEVEPLVPHIARHDPARELAEVAAKRRILDEILPDVDELVELAEDRKARPDGDDAPDPEHTRLLRLLALPYADHLDYRDEWRP